MKKNIALFVVAVLIFITGCTGLKYGLKKHEVNLETQKHRLLDDVKPLRYDLTLWADPNKSIFDGLVSIEVLFKTARSYILIHAEDLGFKSINVRSDRGDVQASLVVLQDGLARIDFGHTLESGTYRLEISYQGNYQQDLSGLYRVKEGDDYYLFTQFEPLSARKMLPCFDEPRFKTPFSVKVISPKEHVVIANNRESTVTSKGAHRVHEFLETEPISTYLLALAVGPFDVVHGKVLAKNKYRSAPIVFRGIATKGKGKKLAFALKETPLIVEKLENYFEAPYPYKKLDILAVPDFSAGAMENVGAITFREWYLLMDKKNASVDQKRGFYLVMAHELSHQWFGNLVTMPWWDDLWLNEAFATWLSYKVVDQIKPDLRSSERLMGRSHSVMAEDSLMSARIIRQPIQSTHDIHNAFDGITYSKGGAVLSMLENYLGESQFQQAVSSHIKRFSFGTATSSDFLASLAHYSQPSLIKSAESFLNQTGVPTVHVSYTCIENKIAFSLSQKRYVPIGSKVPSDRLWSIPLCLGYESNGTLKKHCFTLNEKSAHITIANERCPSFVMPNYDGLGYYRFSMDEESLVKLVSAETPALNSKSRLALADSLLAQFYAGGLELSMVASSLQKLLKGNSSLLAAHYIRLVSEAHDYWVSDKNRPYVLTYAEEDLTGIYRELLKEVPLNDEERELKKKVMRFLAHFVKNKEIRFELLSMGNGFLKKLQGKKEVKTNQAFDENLLGDALAVTLQTKSNEELKNLFDNLGSYTDTVTRQAVLSGVALSRSGHEAHAVRQLVFNEHLRKNEQLRLLYDHLEERKNQPSTWAFLKENFSALQEKLSNPQMSQLPYLADGLCSIEQAKDVEQFFSPIIDQYQGGPRNLSMILEKINICAAQKQRMSTIADNFFHSLKDKSMAGRE